MHISLEIRKFDKKGNQIKTDLDKILHLMRTQLSAKELIGPVPRFYSEEWMTNILKKLDYVKMDPMERVSYEIHLANIGSAQSKRSDELNEREQKTKLQVARSLKDNGMKDEFIANTVNLPIETIKKL